MRRIGVGNIGGQHLLPLGTQGQCLQLEGKRLLDFADHQRAPPCSVLMDSQQAIAVPSPSAASRQAFAGALL
jgi:hypothetical protein